MRKTVTEPLEFRGTGLHTGEESLIRLLPGGEGIRFIKNNIEIPALVKYKSGDARGTSLSSGGETVHTVEHLLSALYGAGVTDCGIEFLEGSEVPIYDGSARVFTEKITGAVGPFRGETNCLTRTGGYEYRSGDVSISWDGGDGDFIVDFTYDGSRFGLEDQRCEIRVDSETYAGTIAHARTFGFYSEIEALRKAGLALGGSLENALVIKDGKPVNGEYRMKNELAVHKILDFIGDMSLSGKRLAGRFVIVGSGHKHNTEFLKQILEG